MDNACDEENIAQLFASKYQTLYNQISYDDDEMEHLTSDLDRLIAQNDCSCATCTHQTFVSPDEVAAAARRLNHGKKDGSGLFSTDHILHGGPELYRSISILFTCMVQTGTAPVPMLDSVVLPIPKNYRKSLNDSGNYRGIALNSPLSKLFEIHILMTHIDVLATTDMQFGFKRRSSTTQCTFVLLEAIQYYLHRDSSVFCMLLDASFRQCAVHCSLPSSH